MYVGFRVQGLGLRVHGSGLRLGSGVWGSLATI